MVRETKDPDSTEKIGLDWTDYLDSDEAEQISASTWSITPSTTPVLSIETDSEDLLRTAVWLSGGKAGTTYRVTNEITTTMGSSDGLVSGSTYHETIILTVEEE